MPANNCKPLPLLSEQDIDRFRSKIDKTPGQGPKGDCHEWKAGRDKKGYGTFCVKHKSYQSHRVALFLHTGCDPFPLHSLHSCDNPPCCNGMHLFRGTTQDNTADRHQKGRDASGDKSGRRVHPERWPDGTVFISAPKLRTEQVNEIRDLYSQGINQHVLAKQFGVIRENISMIVNRKTWKHLPVFAMPPVPTKTVRPPKPYIGPQSGDQHWTHRTPHKVKRGEKNGLTKLTTEAVLSIRELHRQGHTGVSIAKQFGISRAAVSIIISRKAWTHLP